MAVKYIELEGYACNIEIRKDKINQKTVPSKARRAF
jgi:hypothetical protein